MASNPLFQIFLDPALRSFQAPRKFEPMSLYMTAGSPLLATNLLRQATNASVVRSDTISMCVVFTEKHKYTKIHIDNNGL